MVVENVSVAAFRTELTGGEYGVVEYSFRWYGFAATDDRLRAGDATLAEVTPEPDERRPSRPLSGDGWNLDDLWTDFDDCLDGCERIDPCEGSGFRSVEITRPDIVGRQAVSNNVSPRSWIATATRPARSASCTTTVPRMRK